MPIFNKKIPDEITRENRLSQSHLFRYAVGNGYILSRDNGGISGEGYY